MITNCLSYSILLMLHHPHEAQIDRIGALNDSFYKTPCTLIQSPPTSSLSLKMR